MNFIVAITEFYPRIIWELVMDPLGSADHTLGNPSICHYDGFVDAFA